MNTPNKLTLLRVALIPVFLVVLYLGFPYSDQVALAIFVLASATDFADGYLAPIVQLCRLSRVFGKQVHCIK